MGNAPRCIERLGAWRKLKFCVLNSNQQRRKVRGCRSVELRALCNEVPRTPPGPEGSNGIGIASGAADHPKFLALKEVRSREPKANCGELSFKSESMILARAIGKEVWRWFLDVAIALTLILGCTVFVFFVYWLMFGNFK